MTPEETFDYCTSFIQCSALRDQIKIGNDLVADVLRRANVFLLTATDAKLTEEEKEYQMNHFYLPFKEVVISYPYGIMVLQDTEDKQRGVYGSRELMFMMINTDKITMRDNYAKPFAVATTLSVRVTETNMIRHSNQHLFLFTDKGDFSEENLKVDQEEIHKFTRPSLDWCVAKIVQINTPAQFIIEQTPDQLFIPRSTRKIPTSKQRPMYTVLTPGEIKILQGNNVPSDANGKKEPHWRRRHEKHLNSDYYKNKKGQTIWVEAYHTGPDEWNGDGKKYKIRTDL